MNREIHTKASWRAKCALTLMLAAAFVGGFGAMAAVGQLLGW